MRLARDGIQLSFEIAGAGQPAFLFVHGLGGDRTHFAPQMEYFAHKSRVLNAELRGHGESDKPKQVYSIEGFAEDLVWLCTQQNIQKPVIVGQSMGGNMALEIAARYVEFPAGIVLLDSAVFFPESAGRVFAGYLEGLKSQDFENHVREIVADSCLPTDKCRAGVEQTFLTTPQHVMVSTFESLFPWDAYRARDCAKKCQVPMLYIEAAHRLADLDLFAKLCPQLVTAKAVGSGHFLSLEVPEQINPMIDRFISLYARRPG
jgi:pimeloyl-ACP methyl ester carboxylesterase